MKLDVKVSTGLNADGFDAVVRDGDNVVYQESYRYGYNCSYASDFANEDKPYVTDVLQELIDRYQVDKLSVGAGRNTFAEKGVSEVKVEEFKAKYCQGLYIGQSEDDFTLTDKDLNFGDFERSTRIPEEQDKSVDKWNEAFRKNVRVTIESWPKTSRDEVIFSKRTVEISGMTNFSEDVTNAIRNAIIENASRHPDDPLGVYDMNESNVDVRMNTGRSAGLPNTIWGHGVIPGDSLTYLGNAKIKLEVLCNNPDQKLLPNGDSYSDLINYNWDDFADLSAAAMSQPFNQTDEDADDLLEYEDCSADVADCLKQDVQTLDDLKQNGIIDDNTAKELMNWMHENPDLGRPNKPPEYASACYHYKQLVVFKSPKSEEHPGLSEQHDKWGVVSYDTDKPIGLREFDEHGYAIEQGIDASDMIRVGKLRLTSQELMLNKSIDKHNTLSFGNNPDDDWDRAPVFVSPDDDFKKAVESLSLTSPCLQ